MPAAKDLIIPPQAYACGEGPSMASPRTRAVTQVHRNTYQSTCAYYYAIGSGGRVARRSVMCTHHARRTSPPGSRSTIVATTSQKSVERYP